MLWVVFLFFLIVVVVVGPADPDYDLHLKRLRVWRAHSYLLCYNDMARTLLSPGMALER